MIKPGQTLGLECFIKPLYRDARACVLRGPSNATYEVESAYQPLTFPRISTESTSRHRGDVYYSPRRLHFVSAEKVFRLRGEITFHTNDSGRNLTYNLCFLFIPYDFIIKRRFIALIFNEKVLSLPSKYKERILNQTFKNYV